MPSSSRAMPSSSPSVASRRVPLLAAICVASLVGAACGVVADTTAGSVGGRSVSIADVEALARDETFVGLPGDELARSSLPGDLARTVLAFELERAALNDEVDRWGLSVGESDREAAAMGLAEQDPTGWEQLAPRSRELLADYYAGMQVLAVHFAQLDTDDATLRRFYDASPALWAQTCATVVAVDPEVLDDATDAVREGRALEELPEEIPGAELVAVADEQCIDDAQVLPQLREAFGAAAVGEVPDAVVVDTGLPSAFLFRVDERRVVPFDDARPQLEEIVGSLAVQGPMPWVRLMLVDAEVDPRFGSGVVQNPDGSVRIEPPVSPPVPAADEDPFGLGDPGTVDEVPLDEVPIDEAPLDEMPIDEMPLDDATVG